MKKIKKEKEDGGRSMQFAKDRRIGEETIGVEDDCADVEKIESPIEKLPESVYRCRLSKISQNPMS